MERFAALKIAEKEMTKYGLLEKGWLFKFDGSKRRFGLCNYSRKTLSVSRHFVDLNNEEEITNTIRHEVAHALAGNVAGHGPVWKSYAVMVGAKPVRCYSRAETTTPKGAYIIRCPRCQKVWERHKFKPRIICKWCRVPFEWFRRRAVYEERINYGSQVAN